MARVLIVERAGRGERVRSALEAAGFAVRSVDHEPLMPGHVVEGLDNVAVVAWLLGAGENLDPEIHGDQLETVLLKVVDTGVRGVVFERGSDGAANGHVDHARATWHIPIVEIEAGPGGDDAWVASVVAAVNESLGI
jgi:hypothetical protein